MKLTHIWINTRMLLIQYRAIKNKYKYSAAKITEYSTEINCIFYKKKKLYFE